VAEGAEGVGLGQPFERGDGDAERSQTSSIERNGPEARAERMASAWMAARPRTTRRPRRRGIKPPSP
jgi:hypothetical protein